MGLEQEFRGMNEKPKIFGPMTWLQQTLSWNYPRIKMYPDELRRVVAYYERHHEPELDSQCAPAVPMFLMRSYTGVPERLYVDTSKNQIVRCVFFQQYEGQPEHFKNLEIRPSSLRPIPKI
jgi:hypothetical protein